jgi:hypothetical protein
VDPWKKAPAKPGMLLAVPRTHCRAISFACLTRMRSSLASRMFRRPDTSNSAPLLSLPRSTPYVSAYEGRRYSP